MLRFVKQDYQISSLNNSLRISEAFIMLKSCIVDCALAVLRVNSTLGRKWYFELSSIPIVHILWEICFQGYTFSSSSSARFGCFGKSVEVAALRNPHLHRSDMYATCWR